MQFYFGSSGHTRMRKALMALEEPNVMINYASEANEPWDGINRLFIDSGGYSFMKGKGEYESSERDYLAFVNRADADYFALRDYPCEPDVLEEHGRTVKEHIQMSAEKHVDTLAQYDRFDTKAQPVAVLQGWELEDYLECIDVYKDAGVLTDYIGIGSVCRRGEDSAIRRIVNRIARELPDRQIHAFGVKQNIVQYPDMVEQLASADSQAYSFRCRIDAMNGDLPNGTSRDWKDVARHYLNFRHEILTQLNDHDEQEKMSKFA